MGTSTEELSGDIARTRQDLTYDVNALQDKVSPSAIMERRKSALRARWSSAKSRVMGTGSDAAATVGDATSNATSAVEHQVEGSPLAAGLVAFGAGLVVAGLIPASDAEAQAAQRLKEVAQEHGQPLMEEARAAATEVGDNLKDKAAQAADEVKSSAQQSAQHVKDEAPTGSSGPSGTV